jgi:hypothetical protein
MAMSNVPVFPVAVGMATLLAATGVALAAVPALRRRRAVLTVWVLSAAALSLAAFVNLVRLMLELS